MVIGLIEPGRPAREVADLLVAWMSNTRFLFTDIECRQVSPRRKYRGGDLIVYGARVRYARHYYGNRPEASNEPHTRSGWGSRVKKPAYLSFLMGMDWIEMNDTINDFCDHHKICADVNTRHCELRRGWLRRTAYDVEGEDKPWPHSGWKEKQRDCMINGIESPLVPFSRCDCSPAGSYRMIHR